MRQVDVFVHGKSAGLLQEMEKGKHYRFTYHPGYAGPPVSLTMPVRTEGYSFDRFPPFFDGLLPEGIQLEGLLRVRKIDASDLFSQLAAVGEDMVGAVTVKECS